MIHKELEVYKRSMLLVKSIYSVTTHFPPSEMWGLTNQMRRAAVSVPSNIAEGSARHSQKELTQFLNIALGSIAELETQVEITKMLDFIKEEGRASLLNEIVFIRRMLLNLIKSVKSPHNP